jgi:PAS domain S-box-containing protein
MSPLDDLLSFRSMFDAVPHIVWIADANGQIVFLNRQFARYTGTADRSKLLVKSAGGIVEGVVHPEDAPHLIASFAYARATGMPHACEHRIRSATGDYRWFLDRANPWRNPATGEVLRWVGSSVDIHDRRLAEEGLRDLNATLERRVAERTAERNLLTQLIESTDVMVMAIDLGYRVLAINAANADEFQRIFGVRPRAGDNLLALLADRPDLQARVRDGWARGMQGRQATFVDGFGDPDHAQSYHEVTFRPLFDGAGRQTGVYQFVTDVTRRLRREAQLLEAQEALRQAQKMEAMGQLTGGVAHDFNNLLTPIVGALDLLQRMELGNDRTRRLIAGAAQSADRAKTLVQRLLAFARRQPLQLVPVDMAGLIAGMRDLIDSTTGPRIMVEVHAPAGLPCARADPNQLEMALLNLAVNARDAMPAGGTLRIDVALEPIVAETALPLSPGDYLRLSVADSGTGMDQATLTRAVEPFFSTKGIGKGTGLGLSMVHGLASQLGGALTIRSALGSGTVIDLWLPLCEPPLEAIVIAPQAAEVDASRARRILLVDDEDLVRASTADILQDLGHQVVETASADEAQRLLDRGERFDVLVTDHLMPGMTGIDLAARVRRSCPDIAILLVSGYTGAAFDGAVAGLTRLTKPFRKDDMASALAQCLAERPIVATETHMTGLSGTE